MLVLDIYSSCGKNLLILELLSSLIFFHISRNELFKFYELDSACSSIPTVFRKVSFQFFFVFLCNRVKFQKHSITPLIQLVNKIECDQLLFWVSVFHVQTLSNQQHSLILDKNEIISVSFCKPLIQFILIKFHSLIKA